MKKANKFDLKSLLVILLSVTLCFSTVLAACNNNNDSSSSSSSSSTEETKYPTDTQLLKNGDFEYTTFTKKDTDFPVSGSSTSWTIGSDSIGSSSAPAGKASSGIRIQWCLSLSRSGCRSRRRSPHRGSACQDPYSPPRGRVSP